MYNTQASPTHHDTAQIEQQLALFEPIRLDQMKDAALLDRVDRKYMLTLGQLSSVLADLTPDYRVLTVNHKRLNRYQTVYFDTPDFEIYHQHHNGFPDRYKVRARRYVESGVMFFEIKHKTHHNRTIKARVPISGAQTQITSEADGFLGANSPYRACDLEPKLWNEYQRVTLVSKARPERITIDLNVAFGWNGASAALTDVVIVEVKQSSPNQPSDIVPRLRRLGVRAAQFSKYCAGVTLLYDHVKRNNFKMQLQRLQKHIRKDGSYVSVD